MLVMTLVLPLLLLRPYGVCSKHFLEWVMAVGRFSTAAELHFLLLVKKEQAYLLRVLSLEPCHIDTRDLGYLYKCVGY